ncbi:DUF3987 domain-containing protein [Ralstonia pseudosolanacearum]|uniref:DUF3987 domain-containing protein n=1 Tax=Ralstonia pseudosolanacearum TaxID=1310165 RepID=UPI0002C0B8A0|nr:DUF3987 domain-containing protein [Ralstonia pseudosolanacearum]AGH85395.1 hypothetical protein F504_2884 [Ralstonia pseudosolanacearum FQY_4]ANH31778.1 hypothetical protein A3768_0601 [Ralstonia solanacearum]
MNAPAYPYGGGAMPSQHSPLQSAIYPPGYYPPQASHAINALTPSLFRVASEQRAIYGSSHEAILVNLFGKISFAASGNRRVRGHGGKPMPLTLHLRFAGPPLSGKSDTHDRFNAPIIEAMNGWKKRWQFANVTPATLQRKICGGSVLSMLSMAEGRGHLSDQVSGHLSRAFQELSDLYDSHVPAFDRADDDDEVVVHAPDSAILVVCVNVQNDKHRVWLDKYAEDAIGSGYLYRLMMMETDQIAVEGAGSQQPEVALLDYDQRIVEMIASARLNLETMSVNRLPVIEVMAEAEHVLRQAQERFVQMASAALSPNEARVFAVRLTANMRRIAGCMHVYEGYDGAMSADTMVRAMTIAECFAAHWLATVFPPKPAPQHQQDAHALLPNVIGELRRRGVGGIRETDIVTLAKNLGWTPQRTKAALGVLYAVGQFQLVPRTINGRRVEMVELPSSSLHLPPLI